MMTSTLETAILLAAIGIIGIFVFMALFFFIIMGLERLFPHREEPKTVEEYEEYEDGE